MDLSLKSEDILDLYWLYSNENTHKIRSQQYALKEVEHYVQEQKKNIYNLISILTCLFLSSPIREIWIFFRPIFPGTLAPPLISESVATSILSPDLYTTL